MLRRVLLGLSRSPQIKKVPVSSGIVARFVAGESAPEAVLATEKLVSNGLYVTLDHLGEDVTDLAAATATAESTVSQALRMLRASGVVAGRREGRNVYYRLSDGHVRMLLDVTREHVVHTTSATDRGRERSR